MKIALLACFVSTVSMTGLIWFVQIVHYPLFAKVGEEVFAEYERRHGLLTTFVVLPLMFTELGTSIFLAMKPIAEMRSLLIAGAIMVALIWASTFFLQVPKHSVLESGFDLQAWKFLVVSNWIRTVLWTARTILMSYVIWMLIPAEITR